MGWKSFSKGLAHRLGQADQAAEQFLANGIGRWETERRLSPSEIASLRTHLSSGEVQDPIHHLGVHLILSVAIMLPIPGLRSLARFGWTLTYWVKERRPRRDTAATAAKATKIHTPLVMVLSLVPGFGAVAYMASRPLRRKLMVRLMLDQIAIKLPFRLYSRLQLDRRLAPDSR